MHFFFPPIPFPSFVSSAFPVTTPEPLVLVTPPRCLTANRTQQGVLLSWLPPANHSFPIDHYIMEFRVGERWEILDDAILGSDNDFFAKDLSQVRRGRLAVPWTAPSLGPPVAMSAVLQHCGSFLGIFLASLLLVAVLGTGLVSKEIPLPAQEMGGLLKQGWAAPFAGLPKASQCVLLLKEVSHQ